MDTSTNSSKTSTIKMSTYELNNPASSFKPLRRNKAAGSKFRKIQRGFSKEYNLVNVLPSRNSKRKFQKGVVHKNGRVNKSMLKYNLDDLFENHEIFAEAPVSFEKALDPSDLWAKITDLVLHSKNGRIKTIWSKDDNNSNFPFLFVDSKNNDCEEMLKTNNSNFRKFNYYDKKCRAKPALDGHRKSIMITVDSFTSSRKSSQSISPGKSKFADVNHLGVKNTKKMLINEGSPSPLKQSEIEDLKTKIDRKNKNLKLKSLFSRLSQVGSKREVSSKSPSVIINQSKPQRMIRPKAKGIKREKSYLEICERVHKMSQPCHDLYIKTHSKYPPSNPLLKRVTRNFSLQKLTKTKLCTVLPPVKGPVLTDNGEVQRKSLNQRARSVASCKFRVY
ncbi:unnamed protein product [Moneuplotes crassus]|uniref:Uncharacterized protein n=1 Tax=Euplotes crassus TaxID=5936 RepID=A0AAD1U5X8_EUPCR|nr:unnamed protein product [Moneuplotes crassus]